jgi:hypothetical protein
LRKVVESTVAASGGHTASRDLMPTEEPPHPLVLVGEYNTNRLLRRSVQRARGAVESSGPAACDCGPLLAKLCVPFLFINQNRGR